VAVLLAEHRFNKDFSPGMVTQSIVDDRALNYPKLTTSRNFLHLDHAQAHLTSDKYKNLDQKIISSSVESGLRLNDDQKSSTICGFLNACLNSRASKVSEKFPGGWDFF
jgi:hypothetical protein